jgi:hypothetical protein
MDQLYQARIGQFIGFLLINLFLPGWANSQCDLPEPPTITCDSAPMICLDQLCYATTDEHLACCNGWCGINTAIDNPQYYSFVASDPSPQINIHVDNCSVGNGLQCGILDACPWDNANILDCNPGTPPGGTMILKPIVIPGETYILVIDGSNAAVCNYTITLVSGIERVPLTDTLEVSQSFASDSVVCPGYQNLLLTTGPDIPGTHYEWTLGWNGATLESDDPSLIVDIDPLAAEGLWSVCVRALSGCDSTASVCFPLKISSIPTAVKDTATFCPEIFPFSWHGQEISGPGDYITSFSDKHSCSFDSVWTIYQYPVTPPLFIDTFVCDSKFELNGEYFEHSGTYTFVAGQTSYGCDSAVLLNLTIGAPDVFIEVACENDTTVLKAHIIAQDESIDTITFEWYTCAFDSLLSTAPDFRPDSGGCYSLVVNSGTCQDTISSFYGNSGCIFNDLCYFTTSPTCVGVSTLITPVFQVAQGDEIHWLIDYPGAPGTYAGNTDSIYVVFAEPGNYPVSYTLKDTFGTWTCHAFMQVNSGPQVELCCDIFTCDTCATVILTNQSAESAILSLNGGPQFIIGGNQVLNIEICPPEGFPASVAIDTVFSLAYGCPGDIIGDTLITINPFPPALVFIVPINDTLCTYPNDLAAYAWRYCDSTNILSTGNCFVPPKSGCYCLDVENQYGCTYTTCTDFILSATTSFSMGGLQLFPNPTSGIIQVQCPVATILPVTWRLVDRLGQPVTAGALTARNDQLDFTFVPPGIYLVTFIFHDQGTLVRKIIIE